MTSLAEPTEYPSHALILRSPSLDATVLAGREYHLLVVEEAKRTHQLFAVRAGQPDAVVPVQCPLPASPREENKLKRLFTSSC